MDTSRESQLPEYKVAQRIVRRMDVEAPAYDVTCPRCDNHFIVGPSWPVLKPVEGRTDQPPAYPFGRVCPYCSRTAAIPAGLRRRAEVETPTRRRVVKRRKSR
jgi:hypothetical protein